MRKIDYGRSKPRNEARPAGNARPGKKRTDPPPPWIEFWQVSISSRLKIPLRCFIPSFLSAECFYSLFLNFVIFNIRPIYNKLREACNNHVYIDERPNKRDNRALSMKWTLLDRSLKRTESRSYFCISWASSRFDKESSSLNRRASRDPMYDTRAKELGSKVESWTVTKPVCFGRVVTDNYSTTFDIGRPAVVDLRIPLGRARVK